MARIIPLFLIVIVSYIRPAAGSPSVLIAHYKMNENIASVVVEDSSGNDHDGLAQQDTEFIQIKQPRAWHPFVDQQGEIIDSFEDVSDWTVSGTGATAENNTTQFKYGTQSIKVNATGGNQTLLKKTGLSLDTSTKNGFSFWFYVHDIDTLSDYPLAFTISSVDDYSKRFAETILKTQIFSGWNYVTIAKSDFTNNGSESWDNTMIEVRLYVFPATGEDSSVSFDDLRFGIEAKPKIIISFDDNSITQIEKAYPIMAANGQPGVVFIVTGRVGDLGFMTLANLQTLRNAGWDICNHTVSHLYLTYVSQAKMEADIEGGYDWLVANGFGETAKFFAYPYGYYNDDVIAKLKERHVLARIVTRTPMQTHFEIMNYHDLQFKLNCLSVKNTISVATVKAAIDRVIEGGSQLTLLFHYLVTADPVRGEYLTADFQSISDYLKTKQDAGLLEVITYSDYYNELVKNIPKINGAFSFNGSTDYIEIDDHADFTPAGTPFSISAWIYMHDATHFPIVTKGVLNTDGEWRFLLTSTDKLLFTCTDESEDNCTIGRHFNTPLTTYENQWIHVVATYDGGKSSSGVKIYLNGERVDDTNQTNGTFDSVEDLDHAVWIGRYSTNYANGLIDNVMIFSMELTQPEVDILYNNSSGTEMAQTIFVDDDMPAGASEWKSLGGNFERTGLSEYDGPEVGCVKWQFDANGPVSASVTVSFDERVHIASEDGKVYTLDANGVLLWSYDANSPLLSSPTIGPDGTIYVGSENGKLYAVDVNGSLRWTHTTGGPIYSSPAVSADGNSIYVCSQDGILYALEPNGSDLWNFEMDGPAQLPSATFASPAIGADGTIYIAGLYDPNLYALEPNDGSLKWSCSFEFPVEPGNPNSEMKSGLPFASPVVAADGTIYQTLLYDSNLCAIDANNGTIIWSVDLADPTSGWFDANYAEEYFDVDSWSEPALGPDGTIYVSFDDPYLRAVDPNGSIKWVVPIGNTGGFTLAVGSNGLIYAAGDDGNLYVVDSNGCELARFQTDYWLNFPVIAAENTIIVSGINDDAVLTGDVNSTVWSIRGYGCEDLDGNEFVNFIDFALLAADWLNCTDPEYPCNYEGEELYLLADIDVDKYVRFSDLAALAGKWLEEVKWLRPLP